MPISSPPSKQEESITTDVYSTKCELELEKLDVCIGNILPTKFYETKIDGNITILDNEPRIAKICCVTPSYITLTKTFVNGENVVVEGFAKVCIVYEADEDDVILNSIAAEIPFSSTLKNVANLSSNVFVCANIISCGARAKKGKEIDIDLDVCLAIDCYLQNKESIITDVVQKECYPKSEYALKMHVAQAGTTIWELCKGLKANQEDILKQNPNLSFPLTEPASIIYFNKRVNNN